MKTKFIIIPIIVTAPIAIFFLNQQKPNNTSLVNNAIKVAKVNNALVENNVSSKAVEETPSLEVYLNGSETNETLITEEFEERYQQISNNEDYPTLASRIDAINNRRPDANISPENVLAALEKSEAWKAKGSPLPTVKQKLTQEEIDDGRSFIEFDPVKVETLMPGDHMDIAIDELGLTYDMKVDNVEVFNDGNIMWSGSLMNVEGTEAEGGIVTITQSPKITIASVVLLETDFTLESYGTEGWIVDSGVLFKIDPNVTDEVIHPDDKHNH